MRKFGSVKLSDGRTLAFVQYGDPAGKPILYCHGGISSKSDVAFAQKYCEENGFLITSPDRPGIGDSDTQPKRTLLDWGRDSRELLDHLRVEKTAVLGWSLGGPYALACAYSLPERVSSIGTIGGAGQFDDPRAVSQLGLLVDRLLLTVPSWLHAPFAASMHATALLPPQAMKMTLLSNLTSASDREIVSALSLDDSTRFLYESVKRGGMGIIEDYAAVGNPWGFNPLEIQSRTLIWHGDQDQLCPISVAREMAAGMSNAEFLLVDQAGHFLLHRNIEKVLPVLCAHS